MPAPNRIELRTFIVERFKRDELGMLCSDYFLDFYRDYDGTDITLTTLAEALVAHCERRSHLEQLRYALHAARTKPYEASFGAFIAAEVLSKPRNPKQAFLSYAHKDEMLARTLAAELRAAGLAVWIAADGIQPGEKWAEAIDRGLSESGIFIVLLTPNSATSKWVKHEIYLAIQAHMRDEMQIFPLKMTACDDRAFPASLSAFQFVSFESDYAQGRQTLFKQLGVRRVVPLHNDLQYAIASSLTAVRKGAVEELAALLNHPDIDLADTARQALERLCDDDSRVVSNAALAALKPVTSAPLITISVATPLVKIKDRHTLTLAEGVTLELVSVPSGEFIMGSDNGRDNEKPQQVVNLPEYWMGKTPVTVAQFAAFVAAAKHKTQAEKVGKSWGYDGKDWVEIKGAYWAQPRGPKSDVKNKQNHPVTCVSWQDTVAFCQWASEKTKINIILPSEAEWEKAARGQYGRKYPWLGDEITDKHCNYNLHIGDTTAVGSYSDFDSPYGCQDMAGNVWEWTRSVYADYKQQKHHRGWDKDISDTDARVLRGGSFAGDDYSVRCAYRYYRSLANHDNNIGFRVCVPHLSTL